MIYTIGNKKNYLETIKEHGTIQKTGKAIMEEQQEWCEENRLGYDYIGGYCFLTQEDARRRIDEAYADRGFAIFGLNADWETDTYPNPEGGWWHNLLIDADIIVLE